MSMMTTLASTSVLVNVRAEINGHETMTVGLYETNEARHFVVYESERIRDALASFPEGTYVPVEMVRAGLHSDVWEAVVLYDRQTLSTDQSVHTVS